MDREKLWQRIRYRKGRLFVPEREASISSPIVIVRRERNNLFGALRQSAAHCLRCTGALGDLGTGRAHDDRRTVGGHGASLLRRVHSHRRGCSSEHPRAACEPPV